MSLSRLPTVPFELELMRKQPLGGQFLQHHLEEQATLCISSRHLNSP